MCNTNSNWYSALVDKEEVGSLHTISDDNSSTTDKQQHLQQQQLIQEVAADVLEQDKLVQEIDVIIIDYSSNSNSIINSDEDILDFDEMTTTMPDIVSKVKG